jgi:peptide/nickel transport system ATP-binding protein
VIASAPVGEFAVVVEDLRIDVSTSGVDVVDEVSFRIRPGEVLGLVGESGSGKTTVGLALLGHTRRGVRVARGRVTIAGHDVLSLGAEQLRALRGATVSYVPQDPGTALNPNLRIGQQIMEVLVYHRIGANDDERRKRVAEALSEVALPSHDEFLRRYPHQLSGGQQQRVVIAMALACDPELVVLDEPTTGLDVTTQKAVMELVVELTHQRGMSTVLITHDLGLAAAYCDRVVVMQKGEVVETAPSETIFKTPAHAYTRKLMRATPRPGAALRDLLDEQRPAPPPTHPPRQDGRPLLKIANLVKEYPRQGVTKTMAQFFGRKAPAAAEQPFRAVDGISFEIMRGQSVGLVGESGCGKSTTSMMAMRLLDPTSGSIILDGEDIGAIPARAFAKLPARKRIQMVFQDPTDSLNPRFTAMRAIADPILRLGDVRGGDALRVRCEELAQLVGLPRHLLDRFPHQLSGGQKARVGIARAIALHPELVILDEPTAALDVSVQAIVLNLLDELKARLGMSYLFVSHDLHVVRLLCDYVIVMKNGRIVEEGSAEQVLEAPQDEYTRELIAAIPHPPV